MQPAAPLPPPHCMWRPPPPQHCGHLFPSWAVRTGMSACHPHPYSTMKSGTLASLKASSTRAGCSPLFMRPQVCATLARNQTDGQPALAVHECTPGLMTVILPARDEKQGLLCSPPDLQAGEHTIHTLPVVSLQVRSYTQSQLLGSLAAAQGEDTVGKDYSLI